jgi:hypothetical protein
MSQLSFFAAPACPTALAASNDYDSVNCTLFGSYGDGCWAKSGNVDSLAFTRPAAQCYEVATDGSLTKVADASKCTGAADALPVYQLDAADFASTSSITAVTASCEDATSSDVSCKFSNSVPSGKTPSVGSSSNLPCAACAYCVPKVYAYGVGAWAAAAP